MLLTFDDMKFLSKVTTRDEKGNLYAKPDITKKDKERLSEIDELNVMTYDEHLIVNYNELK